MNGPDMTTPEGRAGLTARQGPRGHANEHRAAAELAKRRHEGRTTDALVAPCHRCGNPAYVVADNHPVCDLHEKDGERGSDRERLEAIASATDGPNLQAVLSHVGSDKLERLGIENQLGDLPGEAQREAAERLVKGKDS